MASKDTCPGNWTQASTSSCALLCTVAGAEKYKPSMTCGAVDDSVKVVINARLRSRMNSKRPDQRLSRRSGMISTTAPPFL